MAPADAASATLVLVAEARAPHSALPNARLACVDTRFMATARARTQAGAVVWVPAERLASTPTHAMPAHDVPITASAGRCVAATSNVAAVHRNTLETTMLLSERRPRSRGIDSALATAPNPKPAESRPKPPAPRPSWSRAITGSSAHNALAHTLKLKLRLMSERIAGEWRAKRSPLSTPEKIFSGTPGRAGSRFLQRRSAISIRPKNAALAIRALPVPNHAARAPASAGPMARARFIATAPSATACG